MAASKLIKLLEKKGFRPVRHEGSHLRLIHPNGRSTTVPIHGSKEIEPDLLNTILRQAGISRNEFLNKMKLTGRDWHRIQGHKE
ncbi:MAG: type II toxin-antitoxin system HicA family toxin [Candidatus Aenigmarchaeota archaeon]|nr:type II toxin-antitoxin system HicA family toxin [Candidatus Aenigmarchaeota archaeon]